MPWSKCPVAQPFQHPLPNVPSPLPNWEMVKTDLLPIVNNNASELVQLAFLCASSFRKTDYHGGCNGARIRFPPQSTWPGHSDLDKVLALLDPIRTKYAVNLSWGDLIVYAGTLALNDGQLTFCPGRTDATDGKALDFIAGKNFWNATIAQMRSDQKLLGLTDTEVVVLSARLRSASLLHKNGYEGTWATNNVLSNQYFTTLKAETWQNYTVPVSGHLQYKAAGKNLYILSNDLNLLNDSNYKTVVDKYTDNTVFLNDFRAAWAKLMNMDRFDGPVSNLCHNTSIPIGSHSTTATTATTTGTTKTETGSNGQIWVISILLIVASILI